MNKDEIRKLVGGYASGTLTAAEQQQLFEAALDDQDLFDELQKEQPLKELLSDPVTREELRRVAAESLPKRGIAWFRRPWILAMGASVAAASITIAFLAPWRAPVSEPVPVARSVETARAVRPNASGPGPVAPVNAPAPAPPPVAARKSKALRREPPPADTQFEKTAPPAPTPVQKQDVVEQDKTQSKAQVEVTEASPAVPLPASPQLAQPIGAPAGRAPAQNQEAPVAQARTGHALAKSSQGFRASRMAGSVSQIVAAPYSFSRRLENGAYDRVPVDTVFHANEPIRITFFPTKPGPLSVEEWHAGDSTWHPLLSPVLDATGAVRQYGIPMDIIVKQGERLRVHAGSATYDIVIRTEP